VHRFVSCELAREPSPGREAELRDGAIVRFPERGTVLQSGSIPAVFGSGEDRFGSPGGIRR
jgi:hypothetical protein